MGLTGLTTSASRRIRRPEGLTLPSGVAKTRGVSPSGGMTMEGGDDASTLASTLRDAAEAKGLFVGSAIDNDRLSDSTYSSIASSQFSSVTAENVMKWQTIEPSRNSFNYSPGDTLVDFAQDNDQQVYGHTLVWQSQFPSWVSSGGYSASELNSIMTNHITNVVDHYENDVEYWDVVNMHHHLLLTSDTPAGPVSRPAGVGSVSNHR